MNDRLGQPVTVVPYSRFGIGLPSIPLFESSGNNVVDIIKASCLQNGLIVLIELLYIFVLKMEEIKDHFREGMRRFQTGWKHSAFCKSY